ncbi:MAG: hypothetical protein H6Q73_179 [Firmicutes bacterium]|nr:hypothetical protein [Bacillota bacterium]
MQKCGVDPILGYQLLGDEVTALRQQLRQEQADCAALRWVMSVYFKWHVPAFVVKSATYRKVMEVLESTTAGADLLAKIEQLERENKALRCCGNCQHCKWVYGKARCNENCDVDRSGWQLAERLVSKC